MTEKLNKVAVIGAGGVGATATYAAMMRGVARQYVLHDIDRKKVHAQVLDLNDGLAFLPSAIVEGSDDVAICENSDVIVITCGARQKPGQTRMDLAEANANICRSLLPQLMKVAPKAILLLVTNPVDVITYITLKLTGLPFQRVLGSGAVLDSARFRYLIAQRLKVDVRNVHAYIAGEHGDSEIPLWSSATVANIPLHEWSVPGHGKLSVRDRVEIFENVRTAAYQIVAGKGYTNYAIGLATAQILESLLRNENRIHAVSSLLTDYKGISDVCLSIPCIVNAMGVDQQLSIPMNAAEEAGLRNSADTIRAAIRKLGF